MLTLESVMAAADAWNFNCGPGALCAVLGKTPEEIRPHLLDFERKGYTNPTLMADILRGLGVSFRRVYECQHKVDGREPVYPSFGLVRLLSSGQVVPWLLRECEPKADGTWWPTHCWEVSR
jgi:hypothetical protein